MVSGEFWIIFCSSIVSNIPQVESGHAVSTILVNTIIHLCNMKQSYHCAIMQLSKPKKLKSQRFLKSDPLWLEHEAVTVMGVISLFNSTVVYVTAWPRVGGWVAIFLSYNHGKVATFSLYVINERVVNVFGRYGKKVAMISAICHEKHDPCSGNLPPSGQFLLLLLIVCA